VTPNQPLPEFQIPPLIEVVLGVQFAPKPPLGSAAAGLFWSRIRDAYPRVEAQPPLPPVSPDENSPSALGITIGFIGSQALSRHWFLSDDGSRLLQLQPDRFVHNWRKNDEGSVYPRYATVKASFEEGYGELQRFCADENLGEVDPTVCEVTYINHIVTGEEWKAVGDIGRVLKPLSFDATADAEPPSQFQLGFQRTITNGGGPVGRLDVSSQSVQRLADNKPMILLTISAVGRPTSPDFRGVLDFLDLGHGQVVRSFADLTTPEMHRVWGRTQ
jgi:uncharacterized protein (TIGR04255 family)